MSMRLATTQQQFLHMLIDRPNNLATEIREGGKIDVAARLGIYRHAYRARLTEVMQDIFERTWTYIGDESFEQCAHSYVDRTTPSGRTLQGFGATFPDWLVDRFPDDPDIADVARIDWMLRVAFDGANATPIVIDDLAALTPDDWSVVTFQFHPTIALALLTHNAASIWEALDQGVAPPAATRLNDPTWLLVWRQDFRPHFITVGQVEKLAIDKLRDGISFAETCAQLDTQFPGGDVATAIGLALRRWVDDGLLVGTETSSMQTSRNASTGAPHTSNG